MPKLNAKITPQLLIMNLTFSHYLDDEAMAKSRLVFIIGVTLGGFCFLLFLLILVLTVVVLASCRAAQNTSNKNQGKN